MAVLEGFLQFQVLSVLSMRGVSLSTFWKREIETNST